MIRRALTALAFPLRWLDRRIDAAIRRREAEEARTRREERVVHEGGGVARHLVRVGAHGDWRPAWTDAPPEAAQGSAGCTRILPDGRVRLVR